MKLQPVLIGAIVACAIGTALLITAMCLDNNKAVPWASTISESVRNGKPTPPKTRRVKVQPDINFAKIHPAPLSIPSRDEFTDSLTSISP
jgi:hypothetical protein